MAIRRRRESEAQFGQILQALQELPAEKVTEVLDFVQYLQKRYAGARPIDDSESWSEEDIRDFAAASFAYAQATIWAEEDADE